MLWALALAGVALASIPCAQHTDCPAYFEAREIVIRSYPGYFVGEGLLGVTLGAPASAVVSPITPAVPGGLQEDYVLVSHGRCAPATGGGNVCRAWRETPRCTQDCCESSFQCDPLSYCDLARGLCLPAQRIDTQSVELELQFADRVGMMRTCTEDIECPAYVQADETGIVADNQYCASLGQGCSSTTLGSGPDRRHIVSNGRCLLNRCVRWRVFQSCPSYDCCNKPADCALGAYSCVQGRCVPDSPFGAQGTGGGRAPVLGQSNNRVCQGYSVPRTEYQSVESYCGGALVGCSGTTTPTTLEIDTGRAVSVSPFLSGNSILFTLLGNEFPATPPPAGTRYACQLWRETGSGSDQASFTPENIDCSSGGCQFVQAPSCVSDGQGGFDPVLAGDTCNGATGQRGRVCASTNDCYLGFTCIDGACVATPRLELGVQTCTANSECASYDVVNTAYRSIEEYCGGAPGCEGYLRNGRVYLTTALCEASSGTCVPWRRDLDASC